MTNSIEFNLDLPINPLSFGNVSVAILRECYKRGLQPNIFPLQGQVDMSPQLPDEAFNQWLGYCINKAQKDASRKHTAIRLWHLNGSLNTYSSVDSRLITFQELDQLTNYELNVIRNHEKVYVTSKFSQQVFKIHGVEAEYLPLGFDAHNFRPLEKRPKVEGVISFGLAGKFESRKATGRVLNLWAKKYGNNPKYRLNVAVTNPFIRPEQLQGMIVQALEGKQYFNISFLPFMASNAEYSSFLQANDIHLAMSGGEGWDLPSYHATALGAHLVVLNAHVYQDWTTSENAVLVAPNGKRNAVDGMFFQANSQFNIGNFFDFSNEAFYAGCEEAEKRTAKGINLAGLALQKQTYAATLDVLLKDLK